MCLNKAQMCYYRLIVNGWLVTKMNMSCWRKASSQQKLKIDRFHGALPRASKHMGKYERHPPASVSASNSKD
jgi:hypothetical protein